MEFDKPSTKYLFFAMITVFAFGIGAVFHKIHKMDEARDAEYAQQKQDCIDLNAQYGEVFWVKEGFYSGRELMAVEYGERSVGLVNLFGMEKEILRFRCADVQREVPKKFRKEEESKR
jgi:hypothetical protein